MYEVDENTLCIEERGHKLYILCPYDRLEIVADLKKKRREQMVMNLDAAGIASEQRFAELEGFDDRWNDEQSFIDFVNTVAADVEILRRALRNDNESQVREIITGMNLPRQQMLELKAALAGLQVVAPAAASGEGDAKNPPGAGTGVGPPPGSTYGS